MAYDYSLLDATAQGELVRRGDVSPRELVDSAIARIERLNPQLNAVIHPLFDEGRAQAASITPGKGPFAGVPFLLKDILGHAEGAPVAMGARFLRDLGLRAPNDSYLTTKFRQAGFVILGRTNVPELGVLPTTESDAYGPCRSPWNPAHSTGGSSGGSAAAVASGMVPAAHGNDGGGSIRIPASACGLVGLKPSRGRTSFGPDVGEGSGGLVAEGVLTRSVRDTAAILDQIIGWMPGDPYGAPTPARPYRDEVGADPGKLRIGFMTQAPGSLSPVDPQCVAGVESTAKLLQSLGHHVEDSHPNALDDPIIGQHFSTMYGTHYAHLLDTLSMFVGREIGPDDLDPLTWALASLGRVCTATQYLATVDWMHAFTRYVASWWADGFDLLLTPTLSLPPAPLGYFSPVPDPITAGARATGYASFTLPFNLTGQPAISLPLHWSTDGLPVGMHLVATYGREDVLLRVAAQLEQARPWADRRPKIHASAGGA